MGLQWQPALHDYFAIPDVGMDDRIFALSDMLVTLEVLHGYPAITFNGAVEWALDHIWFADAVWVPREDQLRLLVADWLTAEAEPTVQLQSTATGYTCIIHHDGREESYPATDASEAYAAALLNLMQSATH